MKGPLAGLMQKAQQMQEDMQRVQEELAQQEVTGQSGGGLVSVVMSGRHDGMAAGMNLPPGFKMPF